jgi:16S rRNA (guanine527-N7)-methyltransferase
MDAERSQPTQQMPASATGSAMLTLLQQGCEQLGVPLSATQLTQFEQFYHELVTWNEKFNLTAITEHAEVQTKHFLDCLAALPILTTEWAASAKASPSPRPTFSCVDVGAGAGFPGVPLKIARPSLRWTLMDGTGKKVLFLNQLVANLGLTDVQVVQGRAEELGRQAQFRGQFDLATARAVAPLNTLVEYLLPLVRQGGIAMFYKGASAPQEFMEARRAIELLGGETLRLAPVAVPFLDEKRFLLLVQKVRPTPSQYPRGQGLSRKKPLT